MDCLARLMIRACMGSQESIWFVCCGLQLRTMAYRVFYHGLLITKLHHIDYGNYTDGIYSSKGVIRGFQKM
jgi:hypothetical protein